MDRQGSNRKKRSFARFRGPIRISLTAYIEQFLRELGISSENLVDANLFSYMVTFIFFIATLLAHRYAFVLFIIAKNTF